MDDVDDVDDEEVNDVSDEDDEAEDGGDGGLPSTEGTTNLNGGRNLSEDPPNERSSGEGNVCVLKSRTEKITKNKNKIKIKEKR